MNGISDSLRSEAYACKVWTMPAETIDAHRELYRTRTTPPPVAAKARIDDMAKRHESDLTGAGVQPDTTAHAHPWDVGKRGDRSDCNIVRRPSQGGKAEAD